MERCLVLKEDFIHSCKAALQYRHAVSEHHNSLAAACAQFASSLHGKEYSFYHPPAQLKPLAPLMSKLSCWCHWDDVHSMREMLLVAAIDEHVKLVRCLPTDMTAHTGLANAYVMLSGLYVDPRSMEGFDDERWIPQNKYGESVKAKFRQMSERAIEEFKILNDYAPRDPWVHAQLAYSYRDLQMPKEEIKEYETILQLCPDDKEVLMKLGQLYFQQGHNAQGLQIYERLKRANYKKAESLIHYYG
jgi:tetratricopeptide (TPR) repeat protein